MDCAPPRIVANAKSANLFSPQQEMILGELALQRMSSDVRIVRDEKPATYLNDINSRLTAHLPSTGMKDILQDKIVWSRDFPKALPEFSVDQFSGRLLFYWRLGTETGKAKLKETPELQARAEALGDRIEDFLVEIVDAFAQKTTGMMLVETGNGSFRIGKSLSEADWLVLYDKAISRLLSATPNRPMPSI